MNRPSHHPATQGAIDELRDELLFLDADTQSELAAFIRLCKMPTSIEELTVVDVEVIRLQIAEKLAWAIRQQ